MTCIGHEFQVPSSKNWGRGTWHSALALNL
jgi:hypothetical protein